MDCRRRVLLIAIHPQHDFAAEGFRLVRSNRVRQWALRAGNRANLTGGIEHRVHFLDALLKRPAR
jgi:hypothetical protein